MSRLLALALVALALSGCAGSAEEPASTEAPERDGFSGQMGVMAGDPSSYGE